MNLKIESYLGFARKSGSLLAGQETCSEAMKRGKIKLLIVTEDLSENTTKKLLALAEKTKTPYRIYGHSDRLSAATGLGGTAVYGINNLNFTDVIIKEIDQNRSEKEVF